MKYRVSVVVGLALLAAACARQPEPAPVTEWQPSTSSATTVRVARGDTLFGVAHRYHVPIKLLIAANHLTPPYRLERGSILILPGPDTPMLATAPPSPPPTAPPRPRYNARTYSPPPPPQQAEAPDDAAETSGADSVASARRIDSAEVPPSNRPASRSGSIPRYDSPSPDIKPATATMVPPPVSRSSGQASNTGFIWPVRGRVVEGFGAAANGTHNDGINIAARAGAAVYAAKAGEVVYVGNELRGYGNLILIKHEGGYLTAYAHNAALLVHKGDHVARGQVIARVGATGEVSAPQLHFEIRAGRNPVNPAEFLPPVQQASIGE